MTSTPITKGGDDKNNKKQMERGDDKGTNNKGRNQSDEGRSQLPPVENGAQAVGKFLRILILM